MKCLIIAAGKGSRLRQQGESKPLIPVLGLPLIERVIRTAESPQLERLIERAVEIDLPTKFGDFRLIAFSSMVDPEPHLALCIGGVGELDAEDFGRHDPVDVLIGQEGVNECLVGAQMRQDAQLHLRIVRRKQDTPLCCDEG